MAVEQRAGVSRGARIHHFATKAELLAGVANHLLDLLAAHYDEAFQVGPDAPSEQARVRRGLTLLWSLHRREEYVALLELSMAARTDDALRQQLQSVAEHQRALAAAAVTAYFPRIAGDIAGSLVNTVHAAMLGTVMRGYVEPTLNEAGLIDQLERLVMSYLESGDVEADGQDENARATAKKTPRAARVGARKKTSRGGPAQRKTGDSPC